MKSLVTVFSIMAVIAFSLPVTAGAQEPAHESSAMYEVTEYASGVVQHVSPGRIVVREYDYQTDEDKDVMYIVEMDAELVNVDSVNEIVAGDIVDIEYIEKGGRRAARHLFVEKVFREPEETEERYPLADTPVGKEHMTFEEPEEVSEEPEEPEEIPEPPLSEEGVF